MAGLVDQATVLIVDRDLGFVIWLGEIFSEAGSHVVPALDCARAVSTVNDLKLKIDVVVVNDRLSGIPEMLSVLSAPGRAPKIVAISEAAEAGQAIPGDDVLTKPSSWERVSRSEWWEQAREILRDVQRTGRE